MREFVTNSIDFDSPTKWYYYPDEKKYRRFKDDELRAEIEGDKIPDPNLLWERRQALTPPGRKPTIAVYRIWEHWNAQRQKPDGS